MLTRHHPLPLLSPLSPLFSFPRLSFGSYPWVSTSCTKKLPKQHKNAKCVSSLLSTSPPLDFLVVCPSGRSDRPSPGPATAAGSTMTSPGNRLGAVARRAYTLLARRRSRMAMGNGTTTSTHFERGRAAAATMRMGPALPQGYTHGGGINNG